MLCRTPTHCQAQWSGNMAWSRARRRPEGLSWGLRCMRSPPLLDHQGPSKLQAACLLAPCTSAESSCSTEWCQLGDRNFAIWLHCLTAGEPSFLSRAALHKLRHLR
uniref:Uncharacterized protein n=1 Tax=Oryza rufipogon TaxID=4529 RepID=A0A0E0PEI9_ORYRU